MIDKCRENLPLFNGDFVAEAVGSFSVTEKSEGGAGSVTFTSATPCIVFCTHPRTPLLWALENKKCADGAFLTFSQGQVHLHLVELKSRLASAEWSHAKLQFSGMFLTAIAACRVMDITEIASVTCYIAFTKNKMNPEASANPVLLKTLVGRANPLNGQSDWEKEEVHLPHSTVAGLRKIERDEATKNGVFALAA